MRFLYFFFREKNLKKSKLKNIEKVRKIFFPDFFENQKKSLKNQYKKFEKSQNISGEILIFFEFFYIDFSMKIFGVEKKIIKTIFSRFFTKNFSITIFSKYFLLLQGKISSGIQKSYLEHRASILKIRKLQNPDFP